MEKPIHNDQKDKYSQQAGGGLHACTYSAFRLLVKSSTMPTAINQVAIVARNPALKPVPFRSLPQELQSDVRMLWPAYADVFPEAKKFLFGIGDASTVRRCCESSSVGKKLPDALYVHSSAKEQLPAVLRLLLFAARQIVGDVEYNIVKISSDGRAVSFLSYKDFEDDPHPALLYSVRVYLPRAEYTIRNYSSSDNPPILHRKDLFLDPLHPLYREFRQLSEEEEELGLLGGTDIGNRVGWLAILANCGVTIENHHVVRIIDVRAPDTVRH